MSRATSASASATDSESGQVKKSAGAAKADAGAAAGKADGAGSKAGESNAVVAAGSTAGAALTAPGASLPDAAADGPSASKKPSAKKSLGDAAQKASVLKERDDKIKKVRGEVVKKFGEGSLMTLGDESMRIVPSIPTGCTSLDIALGCGGVPRGRIVEIYGPESSGKTTLTLHLVAQAQASGGVAAFIDAEHALDPGYARKLGVDLDHLLVSQPDSGEQALEIAEMLTTSGGVDLIIIDSVAALVPRAELEGEMGDSHVGLQARLMSQAMRKLTSVTHRTGTTLVFINQIREKIGVMFGSPETTPGGRALKFYASVRLDIRRIGTIKNGEDVVGNRTRVKVVKNKMAAPFRQTEFDILYNKGISYVGDLLDLATARNIATKSGTWFSYGETRLGQGRDRAVTFLEENADLCAELRDKVVAAEAAARKPGAS